MQGDLSHNPGRLRRTRLRYVVPVLVAVPFVVLTAAAILVRSSSPGLEPDTLALAKLSTPLGGGTVVRVIAVGGREQQVIPVRLEDDLVMPRKPVPAGERVTIEATVRRPGWVSWLTGKTERVKLTEVTPVVHPTSTFLTRRGGAPLTVSFDGPVAAVGYGSGRVVTHALSSPTRTLTLHESASAGATVVAAGARTWEKAELTQISWFPAGSRATAVATPAPGSQITPDTRITLTFSKPVGKVLGGHLPPVSPAGSGSWRRVNSRTLRYVPHGYGYGLGADVRVSLPDGVNLAGGQEHGTDPVGQWTVPDGSTLALQQLLAQLGYLPVNFTPANGGSDVAGSPAAEEAAIVHPPAGAFTWRYPGTPAELKSLWSPADFSELTKGAVMAFESAQGLPIDGVAGPDVWKALIDAAVTDQKSTFGYTFVMVSETEPETIHVWHNGKIVVHGLVNTGIAAAPTATGTYAVFEHIPVGTMSGKNPDGTTYHDPGIPDISYFNGGDALHGFIRGSYGSPQSLGCVEMPYSEAGQVYPYTPIGTIVNLTGP